MICCTRPLTPSTPGHLCPQSVRSHLCFNLRLVVGEVPQARKPRPRAWIWRRRSPPDRIDIPPFFQGQPDLRTSLRTLGEPPQDGGVCPPAYRSAVKPVTLQSVGSRLGGTMPFAWRL